MPKPLMHNASQQYNSTLKFYDSTSAPLKVDTTQKTGGKLGTLTYIMPMSHSHTSQSNSSDCKLMTLFPYNHNTALKWTKRWNTDVHLNWLNWFLFLILKGDLLVILIDCMIFLSPFLDVTRMSMSTVSFLVQLDSGILCL